MDTRHSQLVLIEKRVEKANEKINEILEKLSWSRKELTQWYNDRRKLQTCPFNKRHMVPEIAMKEHYRRCLLKNRGAKRLKKSAERPSSLFFYKNSPAVVSFVKDVGLENYKNIIDTTTLLSQQTQQYYVKELEPIPSITEKCQAYDQVVQRSNQLKKHHSNISLKSLSEIDRLVLEKQKKQKNKDHNEREQLNNKRRKQYRVKMKLNTPTEIQKELINAYMQEYNKH